MDNLTYELRQLCLRNRDGSYKTQADRLGVLKLISRELLALGYRHMRASSLKLKHVEALVGSWLDKGLTPNTIKNRLVCIRWWAQKVGKSSEIPKDNASLGIPDRRFVTNQDKSRQLGRALERVRDPHARLSLELQQAFGLRRKECIMIQPERADLGDRIWLTASWTKGSRVREIPLTTAEQREVLNRAKVFVGAGSLIPPQRSYIQQQRVYDGQCKAAGLSHMHGLRHAYAQNRYEVLTGWKSPAAGGPTVRMLSPQQRIVDRHVRQIISRELGHERISITAVTDRHKGAGDDRRNEASFQVGKTDIPEGLRMCGFGSVGKCRVARGWSDFRIAAGRSIKHQAVSVVAQPIHGG